MSKKAIVFDIQRASLHDGPGIRTTIFLKGCPLDCLWCHNPESLGKKRQLSFIIEKCTNCGDCAKVCENEVHSFINGKHLIDYNACDFSGKCIDACNFNALKIIGSEMSVDELMLEIMSDLDYYATSGGGMTLSGGEPLSQFSFSMELLKQCKEMGIHTCVETSGFVSIKHFKEILGYLDMLLFDYKVTGASAHKKFTGVSNETILKNLDAAYLYGVPIILRCPVIPGINDSEIHFNAIVALDKKYPNLHGIEILPYHTMGNSKRTSIGVEETLEQLKTVSPEISASWIELLRSLGCTKAKIG